MRQTRERVCRAGEAREDIVGMGADQAAGRAIAARPADQPVEEDRNEGAGIDVERGGPQRDSRPRPRLGCATISTRALLSDGCFSPMDDSYLSPS